MMKHSFNNPFISCTARDMSFADVERFWCPPFDCYRLDENTLNNSITPIIIEGARGSGKTMILKHQSFFCKKETYPEHAFLEGICNDGFLGVYFRYSADYGSLFDSLICSAQNREKLFNNYFQLCIGIELGKIIREIEDELSFKDKQALLIGLSSLCGKEISDISGYIEWAEQQIRNQDTVIRNSQYNRIDDVTSLPLVSFSVFSLIRIIRESIEQLSDVLFIITIDEFENVGVYQRVINTFIKQLDGINKYTFRIGVRPEGIIDYHTNIGSEFLQDGRDYILARLEVPSDDRSERYRKFVEKVINRRLNTVPAFCHANITIDQLLGRDEDYSWEAKYHTKGKPLRVNDFLDAKYKDDINIKQVVCAEDPLVELYYVMRVNRGANVGDIIQLKQDLDAGIDSALTKKYYLDMQGKYKAALLFWLVDKYRAKKLYYGLSTFIYLSCGSIYDFIGLCRTLFDELETDYYNSLEDDPQIPKEIQNNAARKYATSQLEKVKINHEYGTQMWHFAQNMCNLFSFYHKGDLCTRYPETNQFYIKGHFYNSGLDREIWKSLIKWGVVIKKSSYQRASVSVNGKAQLYYVNKLYYPIFNISCRIRGGYNFALTDEVWNSMIITSVDPSTLVPSKRKKIPETQVDSHSLFEQLTFWD